MLEARSGALLQNSDVGGFPLWMASISPEGDQDCEGMNGSILPDAVPIIAMEDKTEVEAFIQREAHIPGYLERVMLAEDPLMAQFHLSGGLSGIRKNQELRLRVIERFGYAVLSREAVQRLIPYGPFLEVGAGTGYWSYELQKAGCVSIATDLHTPEMTSKPAVEYAFHGGSCYVDVIAMAGEDAAKQHPDKTLLMVWPEWGMNWAYRALRQYAGTTLIYVGEGRGGRTGDDQLQQELEQSWREEERIRIPRFPFVNEAVVVYRKK
jgi:hypothetical protein